MLVSKFPNHIFIPKIVPLVYDDTLSFYEFVCKLLNKVNEAITALNNLGIRVDALEEAVAELQRIVDSFDERITSCEGDISDLKTAVETINGTIENINSAIEGINTRIDNQQTVISNLSSSVTSITNIITNIQEDIVDLDELPGAVSDLETAVDSLEGRVETLEESTIQPAQIVPGNIYFSYDLRNPSDIPYTIEVVEQGTYNPDIFIDSDGWFAFYHGAQNDTVCQLRLPNVLSGLGSFSDLSSTKINLGILLVTPGGAVTDAVNGKTISEWLAAITSDTFFGYMKLELNSIGNYDLILRAYPSNYGFYKYPRYIFMTMGENAITGASIKNFIGNCPQGVIDLIKKHAGNYDSEIAAIESRLDTDEGNITSQGNAISALQSAVGTFTQSQYNTYVNNTANTLSALDSRLDAEEEFLLYQEFEEVFDNKPEGLNIVYFNLIKRGKVVFLTLTASGFNNQQNYPTYKMGTLKAGLRSKLGVSTNCPVVFTGSTLHRTDDTPPRISVASTGNIRLPSVSDMNGVCTGVFNGDWQNNPFNMGSEYDDTKLDKYSLYVALSNSTGGYYNACSFSFCYLTDN